jgi:hypothetical protein
VLVIVRRLASVLPAYARVTVAGVGSGLLHQVEHVVRVVFRANQRVACGQGLGDEPIVRVVNVRFDFLRIRIGIGIRSLAEAIAHEVVLILDGNVQALVVRIDGFLNESTQRVVLPGEGGGALGSRLERTGAPAIIVIRIDDLRQDRVVQ